MNLAQWKQEKNHGKGLVVGTVPRWDSPAEMCSGMCDSLEISLQTRTSTSSSRSTFLANREVRSQRFQRTRRRNRLHVSHHKIWILQAKETFQTLRGNDGTCAVLTCHRDAPTSKSTLQVHVGNSGKGINRLHTLLPRVSSSVIVSYFEHNWQDDLAKAP